MRKRPLWMWLDEAADLLAGGQHHHLAERIIQAGTITADIGNKEKQLTRLIAETQGFMIALSAAEAHATIRFDAVIDLLVDTREQLIKFNELAKETNHAG